jgi:ectoine hydroxylase-related dioxygenase (phytanoyl-CoA dioxygenase family)
MSESQNFECDGYMIVKNLVSQNDLAILTKIVDRIYSQWLTENYRSYVEQQLINMHSLTSPHYFAGFEHERLLFFQTLASKELTNLLASLFGNGLYIHNSQLFFNPFENRKLPYWHRDMQYTPIAEAVQQNQLLNMLSLHIRMPLVHEQGVELIPGTHKRWDTELERNVRLELNGHNNSEDLPNTVIIALEPGDILIFSANMLHRGNYRLNQARKALDICIGKPHPLTSGLLDENILLDVEDLSKISNNQWYRNAKELIAGYKTQTIHGLAG